MAKPAPVRGNSAQRAWLITSPLAFFALICTAGFWLADPYWYEQWALALLIFGCYLIAYRSGFSIVNRRTSLTVTMTDVPLVLALFYLSPVAAILVVCVAVLIDQIRLKSPPTKQWFNLAKSAAGICAALLVTVPFRPLDDASPAAWAVLATAMAVNALVEVLSFAGVIALVQGLSSGQEALRRGLSATPTTGINTVIGLVFVVALGRLPGPPSSSWSWWARSSWS
jgi:hypothetical protein